MEPWRQTSDPNKNLVDAIEEGKIVRVSEKYAKFEGLPILRKPLERTPEQRNQSNMEEERLPIDDLRKPLSTKNNQVLSELIPNFQWEIAKRRRQANLTRKQLAININEPESNLKLIENGVLPSNDFVIINKLQSALHINLRKDKVDFSKSPRSLITKSEETEEKPESNIEDDEIELLEDED